MKHSLLFYYYNVLTIYLKCDIFTIKIQIYHYGGLFMKIKSAPRKSIKYVWCLGFLGFQGFTYFITGNPLSLFWFGFFSFFAYYFIAKMADEMQDERYFENSKKAKLKTAIIPLATLFIIGFFSGFPFVTKELIILTCAFGWTVTLIFYAILFWYYDKY